MYTYKNKVNLKHSNQYTEYQSKRYMVRDTAFKPSKCHILSNEEKQKIAIDLKNRGIIDDATLQPSKPFATKVISSRKEGYWSRKGYWKRYYKSNLYLYTKKQAGI